MWAGFLERPQPNQRLHVVAADTGVVGFACFGSCRDSDDAALGELYAINLDPSHWGPGIRPPSAVGGRRRADRLRWRRPVLWVVPENARARGLYESAGWVDDGGRRHDEVLGARVDEMRYRITLRP